jgi:hypothetical protein
MRKFRWARWARADILTLIGIVVAVVGVVVAYFAIPDEDKVEPELRTRDKESAAFQLGQAKVLYTQIELTLQYRLQTKADPDWINNPKVERLNSSKFEWPIFSQLLDTYTAY